MATTTKKVLVLSFGFSEDTEEKATINISNPREDLTDEEVKTAMEAVKTAGALGNKVLESGADLILEANYVNTETEEIAL